jgi:hypothetical protein
LKKSLSLQTEKVEYDMHGGGDQIVEALLSLGLADDNEHVKNLLQEKHPQRDLPATLPIDPSMEYPVKNGDVRKAMKSFQKGSASGPDGFHPQYYKDILTGPSDTASNSFVDSYVSYARCYEN